jgi:hydrogenase maturation factor HypE
MRRSVGKWNEVTRDTIGNISGTITNTGIRANIDGIGFTADLAMTIQANRQSITINPTGATDISQVAITLTRI